MNPRSALVADRAAATSLPGRNGSHSNRSGMPSTPAVPAPAVLPAAGSTDGEEPGAEVVAAGDPVAPSPERLAARRVIDMAKLVLMTRRDMSEPEAYRWIQKTAMDRRITMATVAATIIDGVEQPTVVGEPHPAATIIDGLEQPPVAGDPHPATTLTANTLS